MDKLTKEIIKFREFEKEDAERAKKTEKKKVSINPDTYIAKEILYQTSLLKGILKELFYIHNLLVERKQTYENTKTTNRQ